MELGAFLLMGCVVSLLCLGVLGVGAVIFLRFAGTSVAEIFGSAMEVIGGGEDEGNQEPRRRSAPVAASRSDLRAKAQSLDFDAALQRYQGGEQETVQGNNTMNAQSAARPPRKAHPQADDDSPRRRLRRGSSLSDEDNTPGASIHFDDAEPRNLRSQRSNSRRDGYQIYDDAEGDDEGGIIDQFFG